VEIHLDISRYVWDQNNFVLFTKVSTIVFFRTNLENETLDLKAEVELNKDSISKVKRY